jgi:TrpR-related protein YerC/YecD
MESDHHSDLHELSDAILSLKTKSDVDNFLKDLCTPSENKALRERWLVCQLLYKGNLSYREINEKTKVSLTTIVRVARFLREESNHGYKEILDKITGKK